MAEHTTRFDKFREKLAIGVLTLLGAQVAPLPEPPELMASGAQPGDGLPLLVFALSLDEAETIIAYSQAQAMLEPYAVRASHRVAHGEFEGAIEDLAHAIGAVTAAIKPQVASRLYSLRAIAHLSLRHDGEADRDCDAALRLDSQNAEALQVRGTLRAETRDLPGAEADFMAYYRLRPQTARALSNLAWLRFLRKDSGVALRMAEDALSRDRGDALAHYILGRVYASQKRWREAVDAYRLALAHWPNPDSPQAAPHTDLMRGFIARWAPNSEEPSEPITQ
jgi:tetratricopeptide (TPR) repeat protein